jgi:hypothetical protein
MHKTINVVMRSLLLLSMLSIATTGRAGAGTVEYQFKVVSGKGKPVCEVLAKKLNATYFAKPPLCGIPEGTSTDGFTNLTRVMLTPDQVVKLWSKIFWFVQAQDQSATSEQAPPEEARSLVGTDIVAWRFEPQVSLNNTGRADNILIWQGYGVDTMKAECGTDVFLLGELQPFYATQLGFVLTPDNQQIDVTKTRELFGHPSADSVTRPPTLSVGRKPFDEIGTSVGVFKYGELFYISTFYEKSTGDFYGKRKYQDALKSTLAVVLRDKGRSTLACEIRMNRRDKFRSTK